MKNQDIKNFWEKCDDVFAHLKPGKWLADGDENKMIKSFDKKLWKFKVENKTVVDYGIGAGYFGLYLLKNHNIKKYIGIDIAQRSLDAAFIKLSDYKNIELKLTPVDFSSLNADLFASFAVIQHFYNREYLNDFLLNLNNSKISELILQIRYGEETKFNTKYDSEEDARIACVTNLEYLKKYLNNYKCVNIGDIDKDNHYQFLYFKIK